MSYDDIFEWLFLVGVFISIIIGLLMYEWREYHHGSHNYHVKNVILTYRIITNTSNSYKSVYKLFSKTKTFEQLTNDSRLVELRGYKENLLSIIEELKTQDDIDKPIREELKKVTPELVNMVDVARRAKRLKGNCP